MRVSRQGSLLQDCSSGLVVLVVVVRGRCISPIAIAIIVVVYLMVDLLVLMLIVLVFLLLLIVILFIILTNNELGQWNTSHLSISLSQSISISVTKLGRSERVCE